MLDGSNLQGYLTGGTRLAWPLLNVCIPNSLDALSLGEDVDLERFGKSVARDKLTIRC